MTVTKLPEGWIELPIEKLAQITTGSRDTKDRENNGEYPFFVRSQTVERINSIGFDGEGVLTAGDGVGTGKIFHYINGKCDFHQRVYLMHSFSPEITSQYFFYYFSSFFYDRIMSMTAKSSVDSVRREMITDMMVRLPMDPNEQDRIVNALSDADALIEGLERLIAKKRRIKQGAMQDLLTAKRRLPGFSGEWVETTFGQCFHFLRTGSASRSQLGTNFGVGYIHYGDIHGMTSVILDPSKSRLPQIAPEQVSTLSRIRDGDLVIADASEDLKDVGKSIELRGVGQAEIVAGLHTFLLRGNPEIVADGFKAYIQFLGDVRAGIENIATGSSVYGISKKNLARLEFKVPPIEEQAAIGRIFAVMDAEIQALETRIDKARQVKEGMMQNLLTGRIRLV